MKTKNKETLNPVQGFSQRKSFILSNEVIFEAIKSQIDLPETTTLKKVLVKNNQVKCILHSDDFPANPPDFNALTVPRQPKKEPVKVLPKKVLNVGKIAGR
jgi:hypothetical protein